VPGWATPDTRHPVRMALQRHNRFWYPYAMPALLPRRRRLALCAAGLALLGLPSLATAASVAYIDNGEVWLSTTDGAKKVRLSGGQGNWTEVAASDNGRVAGVQRDGSSTRAATFTVWGPDGGVLNTGGLTSPAGWLIYAYPVGFDISGDGQWLAYGYSNTAGFGMSQTFQTGHYLRNVGHGYIDPYVGNPTGLQWPTFYGSRLVTESGGTVNLQAAASAPFNTDHPAWFGTTGTGLELTRSEISANGALVAFELVQWTTGTRTQGKIGVIAIDAPGGNFIGPVDCYLPVTGVATDVSLSQDATQVAWHDDQGVRVGGAPTGAADPCQLTAPAVVLSATGKFPSIGTTSVDAVIAARNPGGGNPGGGNPGGGGGSTTPAPFTVKTPKTATIRVLAAAGLALPVTAPAAGVITVTGSVPAKRVGRRGAPVVVAKARAKAGGAGTVKMRLRLTPVGKTLRARLKGAPMSVRITQGRKTLTRRIVLR